MSSSDEIVVVTIEGSTTPCVILPTGRRQTVRLTPTVQGLINRGFVVLVDRQTINESPLDKLQAT
jgi:hypothetical protein